MAEAFMLKGKTVLITGAAKRLGKATALALASQGIKIIIHYNTSSTSADALCKIINKQGGQAWTFCADLSQSHSCTSLIKKAQEYTGSLDILINNASIFLQDTIRNIVDDDLFTNIRINALAPLLLSRTFAEQTKEGVIINFLDTRIVEYDARHAAYHISKRLLFTLTRMLALEYAPQIRVNAVAPGLILPPAGKDINYLKAHAQNNPLKRYGNPTDIADAVLFLIRSTFITGQVIFVDGGYHIKGCTYG